MRKIKSVKLLKDLPGVPSGTIGRFKEKTEINDIYEFLRTIDFGVNFMKDFPTWFEIEYEEERKYIDVRIEVDNDVKLYGQDFTAKGLERFLVQDRMVKRDSIKVTELPEPFSRKDMIQFADYRNNLKDENTETCLNRFFSERSNK